MKFPYMSLDVQRFDFLYEQHLTNLTLQGKQPTTIDVCSQTILISINDFMMMFTLLWLY